MKINVSKTTSENCPSFDICQFNKCPLHEDYENFEVFECDKLLFNFHKCRCSKKKRMEIGTYFNLSNKGLTSRELAGLKRWNSLSPEEQQMKREEIRKRGDLLRHSQKGYAKIHAEQGTLKLTRTNELRWALKSILEQGVRC